MATYKTLRGPRAGLILCKADFKTRVDRAVFPVSQDGTNIMQIAGLAAALFEAQQSSFEGYCQQVLENAQVLAEGLIDKGFSLVTGGTKNHACLIDLSQSNLSGRQAAATLARVNIICNANQIPFDSGPPANPSGLRLGTAAVTTLGMNTGHMLQIAAMVERGLSAFQQPEKLRALGVDVLNFRSQFVDNEFLKTPYANPLQIETNDAAMNPAWDESSGDVPLHQGREQGSV